MTPETVGASRALLALLDDPMLDIHPPPFDGRLCWPEDDTPEAAPARQSLARHIEGVDAIAQTIEDLDDEALTAEARDELSAMLVGAIAGTKRKVDDTARVLAMFAHLETAAMCERDRLDKRAKLFARQAERLQTYVLATLEASGLDRIDGELATLRRQRNPPRLEIAAGTDIAHQWLVCPDPPAPRPDKDAIKRQLKAGHSVPGCSLVAEYRLVRS